MEVFRCVWVGLVDRERRRDGVTHYYVTEGFRIVLRVLLSFGSDERWGSLDIPLVFLVPFGGDGRETGSDGEKNASGGMRCGFFVMSTTASCTAGADQTGPTCFAATGEKGCT